jgi:hypothetical protein
MSDRVTAINGQLVKLDDIPDDQLQAILEERRLKKTQEAAKKHQLYVDTLKNIGYHVLPLMEHGRTTCDQKFNGAFNDGNLPRCSKCGLEAVINGDEDLPEGIKLVIRFERV